MMKTNYSRTKLGELDRVVKTYMRKGDRFIELCCGWSTFGSVAKYYGYSGVGCDIWDVAIEHSTRQIAAMPGDGKVKIEHGDAMDTKYKDNEFDFLYCNPPFLDQEMYGGTENDIADKNVGKFREKIEKMLGECLRIIKPGALAVITINDGRKAGNIVPLGSYMLSWGLEVGFVIHDIAIGEIRSLALKMRKDAYARRRTVKCHEYILTFRKPVTK